MFPVVLKSILYVVKSKTRKNNRFTGQFFIVRIDYIIVFSFVSIFVASLFIFMYFKAIIVYLCRNSLNIFSNENLLIIFMFYYNQNCMHFDVGIFLSIIINILIFNDVNLNLRRFTFRFTSLRELN